MRGKWNEEIMEELRGRLKRFKGEQMRKIDRFERRLIGKIDQKTEEVRVLIEATEEGRLIDFARLNPNEYEETMRKLCKTVGRVKIREVKEKGKCPRCHPR